MAIAFFRGEWENSNIYEGVENTLGPFRYTGGEQNRREEQSKLFEKRRVSSLRLGPFTGSPWIEIKRSSGPDRRETPSELSM